MTAKFILFTKDSCGPCGLVKRYFNALKDDRTKLIQEVQLEDFSDEPIPEENLALAKKYGVTATPVLIIIDEETEELLETYSSGMPITQNIRKLWTKYGVYFLDSPSSILPSCRDELYSTCQLEVLLSGGPVVNPRSCRRI